MAVRKRKVTRRNYRDFYKEALKVDFGAEMHIHHIDGNRDNNTLGNLVALPKELHQRYHFFKNGIHSFKGYFNLGSISSYELNDIINFFICYKECMKWINERDYRAFEVGASERPDMIVTKE